jgi:predicted RNA-binding Zn-ribbon protein involved in translation (DUF1610 family)
MTTKAFLRRERLYVGGSNGHTCRVGAEYGQPDDGLLVEMGPVTGAWYDVPLPACPDCGGEVVWAEAGYVPGTRQCTGCGSLFSVQTERVPDPPAKPVKYSYECDNGHVWSMTEAEAAASNYRCPKCGGYSV